MDVNNLTSVYNQNPTLQGQYTLPEYLALFGQGGASTPAQTPDSTPAPDSGQGIINAGINQYQNQGGNNQINVQSFRTDPRVGGALEAYDRNKQLTSMGINDPFANEISLQDAYYDDMPNFDDSPGSQSMMNKIKSGIGKAMQYTPSRMIGNIAMKGLNALGKYLPVNERAIRENIQGNLGVRVDDIGRIVNTGNYSDPENIMAGYSNPTEKTFDKRIDKTSETLSSKYGLSQQQINGILDGTLDDDETENINNLAFNKTMGKTTNLVKQLRSLNIAKDRSKFANNIAKKEVERKKQEAAAAKQAATIEQIRQQYAAQGRDYGQGAASQATQDSYSGSDGSYSGQGEASDWGGGEKDGGYIDGTNRRVDFKNGGATNGSGDAALSAKVKELMDDGYEFGEAIKEAMKQGYANGGKVNYFKNGVVSLRNGGAPMYSEEDFPILLDPRRPDGSKPSLYDYDGQYDNYDDEVIEIPTGAKMKKPKKKKKKKTKSYFKGGIVSLRGR